MENKYGKAIQITVKISPKTYKSLQTLSAKDNQNMSDIVRKFIDKGLTVQGYRDDIDFISGLVRQEVKVEVEKQANRLEKMIDKIGIIASSNYFLAVRMLSDVISPSLQVDFKDINTQARQLGVDYMRLNGFSSKKFVEDEDAVDAAVNSLKIDPLDDRY